MRKLLFALLLTALAPAASRTVTAEPLTEKQIARLESLCRVWGVVKFFHPWIVAPPDGKPIDWDAALIETIPLVEKATTAEEFRDALNHMFAALKDPATIAMIRPLSESSYGPNNSERVQPSAKLIETGGKKVLLITATDWPRLTADLNKPLSGMFSTAFKDAEQTHGIVLDLRRDNVPKEPNDSTAYRMRSALLTDIAELLTSDLPLPANRSRFHSGYAPESGTTSGGYHSGLTIDEPKVVTAKPGASAGKRLVVLINNGSGLIATALLSSLQAAGQALVLHESAPPQNLVEGTVYWIRVSDGVDVRMRTADSVNADGTVGFLPDIMLEKESGGGDRLLETALSLVGGEISAPPRRSLRFAAGPMRRVENSYPEMKSPTREFRLLGLFRVWNVMHYFFPYKHLMDRSWDSVLTEFIPRFALAATPADYGLLARELVTHLQDAHVAASGGIANSAFEGLLGAARPMLQLRSIGGKMVVIAVDASVHDRVNVGDVVLAVDGVPIAERGAKLQKYIAASTPQRLQNRVASWVLGGPASSSARLKLLRPDGQIREETILRPAVNQASIAARTALSEGTRQKTPVFCVLPDGYGYFDLERLTKQQVAAAFEAVKNTPALIMDMRGYPKETAWAICARLTDKPMTMAMARRPYLTSPDSGARAQTSYSFLQHIEPSPLWKYTGRVVVLINEDAISQAEHSCLGFEEAAKGRITFIGTPTAGANGDVTRTSMPGGITVTFSGHDVRHADGRQLQRLGIQPDIRVEPTIEGIVSGKDEALEAAIKFLNASKAR